MGTPINFFVNLFFYLGNFMLDLLLPKYKSIESISNSSPDYISFSQGTVKLGGTPQIIKDHIREKLLSDALDYYQYVGGIFALRSKIAEKLSKKEKMAVDPEQIIISHGAIGGITAICLMLLRSGDEVILPEPIYPSYRNIVLFSKAVPKFVQGYSRENGQWIFDLEAIQKTATPRTKMLILSNPSNPTGMVMDAETLKSLQQWCESKGIYLVSDEVYDHYIYDETFHSYTKCALTSDFVLRTGSFSKDYAMSGWRVGFIVAPKALASRLIAVQDGTLCCPSVVGQYAALCALEHEELIGEQVAIVRNNRDLSFELLQPLMEKGIFSISKPAAGIFHFIKTNEKDSEPLVMDILRKAKVALVPGKDFGGSPEASASIRLCFARQEPILRQGIERLVGYFNA
jgi:aspartate/methionine/tyrosine aminotransferase